MHLPHRDGCGKALQLHRAQAGAVEQPADQPLRAGADDDAIRRRLGLQPGGQVRRLADDIDLARLALADHHLAGCNSEAHAKRDVAERAQLRHVAHDAEGGADGALGIVLVPLRIAEIRQNAVAAEPRDLSAVKLDRGGAARLVCVQQDAHLFRVEPRREFRRRREIRKQNRQLSPFSSLVRAGAIARRRRGLGGGPAQSLLDGAQEMPAQPDGEPELLEVVLRQILQRIEVDVLLGQARGQLAEAPSIQPCRQIGHRCAIAPAPSSRARRACGTPSGKPGNGRCACCR